MLLKTLGAANHKIVYTPTVSTTPSAQKLSSNIWEQQGYKDLLLTKFCMDSNFGAGLSLSRQQRPNKPEARWGMDIVRDKRGQSDKRCDTTEINSSTI